MVTKTVNTDLGFGGVGTITGIRNGVATDEPATFGQLSSAIQGLAWKQHARVAAQVNVTVASPGGTINAITMVAGEIVLLFNQTAQTENGLYVWNGAAIPMTRTTDTDTANKLESAVTTVDEGTSAGITYRQTQVNFTLGSGNVIWTTFGTATPAATETTAGIAQVATQAETDAGTIDTDMVTPLKLKNASFLPKKYVTTFGDGSATSYTITHSLGNLRPIASVSLTASPFGTIDCVIENTTANTVTVKVNVAPATNAYTIEVIG